MTKSEIKDKIAELEKEICELQEALEDCAEIWQPEEGETFFLEVNGIIDTFRYNKYSDEFDYRATKGGRAYPTKEKAEFEANREKYTRLFRQYVEQHSESLDWHNIDQAKYFISHYEDSEKAFILDYDFAAQKPFVIYADCIQLLKDAINFVGESNIKKYILQCEE